MSEDEQQHEVNLTRRIRTEEYAMTYNKDALKDPSFSSRTEVITTSLYCACNNCIKFGCYGKPIKCIDPYLIDMRYTHWIYHDLVAASKTASTRVATTTNKPAPRTSTRVATTTKKPAPRTSSEEPKRKRRKR